MYGGIATDWSASGYERKRWVRPTQGRGRNTTDSLDDIQSEAVGGQDLTVFPGEAATVQFMEKFQARKRIEAVVDHYRVHGFYSSRDELGKISESSRAVAKKLLKQLPNDVPLPTVAPDGETGILFHWQFGGREVVVTVVDHILHCVNNAGTPQANYLDDLPFQDDQVPQGILAALA